MTSSLVDQDVLVVEVLVDRGGGAELERGRRGAQVLGDLGGGLALPPAGVRATRAAQAWRLTTSVSSVKRRSSSSRRVQRGQPLGRALDRVQGGGLVVAGHDIVQRLTVDGHVDQHRQLGDTADRLGHPGSGADANAWSHRPRRIASTRWAWLAWGYSLPTRVSVASPAWPLLPGASPVTS